VPSDKAELKERSELILSMQANALAKRLKHTGAKSAVIGISGGLDSTLALLVTAKAFDIIGKERKGITAITMPGFGTTGRTYQNALSLIECVGATAKEVNITESVLQHFKDIGQDKDCYDVTYENSQARMRTLILMDTANKEGGMVIGTGDLSELALGWCTYNGDHMSMYAVNSSVPKTLVKYLVAAVGKREGGKTERVLQDILNTEISPELLPPDKEGNIAQKTEDLVGPYELHDFYLYYAIRWGFSPCKIFYLAKRTFADKYDGETLKKWLKNFYRRFFSQQFKRSCIPDGVKIGSVTLSPRADWRMPSDAQAALWLEEAEHCE
jgi:NAD+ synthase (glutamine-hydrolysing)